MPARPQAGQCVCIKQARFWQPQHVRSQANTSPVTPVRPHAGQCIRVWVNVSPTTPARSRAGRHAPDHVSTSAIRQTRPQPRQYVRDLAATSPTMSARLQAGKRVPNHVSMSASRPAHSCASKHIPDYVGASACGPMASAYVHYKYIFSISFVSLTIYFPAPCPATHPRSWPPSSTTHVDSHVVARHHNILFLCLSYWCDQMYWLPKCHYSD